MKDISTHDHVQRLAICIERRVRAECIIKIQPSGPHAASVKARQREERAALEALNRHLKGCVDLIVEHKIPGQHQAKLSVVTRPIRRGLKKIKKS